MQWIQKNNDKEKNNGQQHTTRKLQIEKHEPQIKDGLSSPLVAHNMLPLSDTTTKGVKDDTNIVSIQNS
jgi:hypothetical protein